MTDTIEWDHARPGQAQDAGDAKLHVVFYSHFIKDELKSAAEGRYVAKDTVFTKIFMPGDRTNIIDRPLRDSDLARFPTQYAKFKLNQEQRADGTPLAEWPIVSRGQAEELKYLGFTTVEQIVGASDNVNYMGLQDLKAKAKAFLEISKGNTAPITALSAELTTQKEQNKVLNEAMELLKKEVKELTDKIVKGK